MRSGTARTEYDWVSGDERAAVRVETFVSRADAAPARTRLELTPAQAGRYRVRFALAGRPPPRRLALGRIERADPRWGPADIWYPGHMIVRSRRVTRSRPARGSTLTATPAGRDTRLAQAARVAWPASLAGFAVRRVAVGRHGAGRGRLRRAARPALHVHPDRRRMTDADRTGRGRAEAGPPRWDRLAAANAEAWARRWETDILVEGNPELQRVVRSMLFYLLCSADSGTALGIPPMGLSSGGYYGHIFWDSDTWMFPSAPAHPSRRRPLAGGVPGPHPARRPGQRPGQRLPRRDVSLGGRRAGHGRPRRTSPRRTPAPRSTSTATSPWRSGSTTSPPATPPGSRARAFPVLRGDRRLLGEPRRPRLARAATTSQRGLGGRGADRRERRRVHQRGRPEEPRDRDGREPAAGRAPDPRWDSVAAGKLHLPYDSASDFFRTYEGAPDSTLGDVTPLLAYPLGVAMSAPAKRAQLEQAVRTLLAEGPGAMMGSTLLSVDAAELGDRAWWTRCCPTAIAGTLKGPFLMLSETPDQQRGELRDRRRRVPAAGDLRLHRAALRRRRGSSRRSTRCCPRSVSRLILRGHLAQGPALRRGGRRRAGGASCPNEGAGR